jgi:hypothetical protein
MSASGSIARAASALVIAMAMNGAFAADTLVWTETSQDFSRFPFSTVGVVVKGSDLPGGATAPVVSSATEVKGPNGVEFAAGRIWWPDAQLNRIASVAADGSDYRSISASNPYDLDVQGNSLYWTQNASGQIFRVNLAATPPRSVSFMTELVQPFAIDVTAEGIYWSEVGSSNRIQRSDLDGTNRTTLLTGIQSYDFEIVGSQIYYTTTDGSVKRSGLDGGTLVTLATGQGFLNGIDVTDDSIYVSSLNGIFEGPGFTTLGAGRLRRMDLDGGNPTEIYVGSQVYGGDAPFNPAAVRGVAVAAVPEPETYALLLAGLALVGCIALRRN